MTDPIQAVEHAYGHTSSMLDNDTFWRLQAGAALFIEIWAREHISW